MKRWGLGTYHGLRRKHADTYLNEFVFRSTAASIVTLRSKPCSASRRITRPRAIRDIIGHANPRKGTATPRRAPRSRKSPQPECARTAQAASNRPPKSSSYYVLATLNVRRSLGRRNKLPTIHVL